MKKFFIVFLLIAITCMFAIDKTEARECKYNYGGKTITLDFIKNADTDEFTTDFRIDKKDGYNDVFNFADGTLITSDDQCLNALTVCELKLNDVSPGINMINGVAMIGIGAAGGPVGLAAGFTGAIITGIVNNMNKEVYLGVFGSSLDTLTIDDAYAKSFYYQDKNSWSNYFLTGRGVTCKIAEYSGEKLDKSKMVSYCDKFVQLYSNLANSYKDFENCEKETTKNSEKSSVARCKSKAITNVNKHMDTLKDTCSSILQNQSLSVEDGCVSSCLRANKTIQTLKEKYIGLENFDNDCSISDKLVFWLKNILKWIKYIVPVVVMVLGILDFVKAIAAGKDDELKKAQGNFIKRLIAAALLFIIPLIIVFVLDKMGFAANGCGIIDL